MPLTSADIFTILENTMSAKRVSIFIVFILSFISVYPFSLYAGTINAHPELIDKKDATYVARVSSSIIVLGFTPVILPKAIVFVDDNIVYTGDTISSFFGGNIQFNIDGITATLFNGFDVDGYETIDYVLYYKGDYYEFLPLYDCASKLWAGEDCKPINR
jgi:hypothetical protein